MKKGRGDVGPKLASVLFLMTRMNLGLSLLAAVLACALGPKPSFAQASILYALDPFNPNNSGLHISSATLSSSYFLDSLPGGSGFPAGESMSSSSYMLQGSMSMGWSKTTPKSIVSINYSPSYIRTFGFSSYRSFNQALGVSGSRKLTSKLTVASSFNGMVSDFSSLLFAPSLYGSLSSLPASFEELLAAMLGGQTGNSALAQIISAAQINGSPSTAFLYGGRELSAAADVSLAYAQSARSTFNVSFAAIRTQFLGEGSSESTTGPASIVPSNTMASANLGWSYSLTPRTTLGVNVSSSRVFSKYESAYPIQITSSIGRTLSPHWFVQASYGVGYSSVVRQTFATPRTAVPEYGGSVGYKFKAQTLVGSYMRSVSDPYGVGAYGNDAGNGGWTWNRPGSGISVSGSFGYTRLTVPAFPAAIGWSLQASVSRRLTSQLLMSTTYSRAAYPDRVFSQSPNFSTSGIMAGLSWSPSLRQ